MQVSNPTFFIIHIHIKMSSSKTRKRRKIVKKTEVPSDTGDQLLEPSTTKDNSPKESAGVEFSLKDVIQKVRDMTWTPPVYIYAIKARNSGLSTVDLNQNQTLLACSFSESSDIFIHQHIEKNPIATTDVDLLTRFNTVRVTNKEFENKKALNTSNGPYRYLHGHTLPVTGLKFASQKGLLMSCSLDGTVRAWNIRNLRQEKLYSGIDEYFEDIDVSRDSSHFATACINGPLCQFSFERTYPVQHFVGHSADVKCVRFHPNGMYLASASDDRTIKLWSPQSASVARNFQDDAIPRTLAFSPDGKYLASYSGGAIKIWDLASGQLLKKLDDSSAESTYHSLCFSEFGEVLASGGVQKKLKLWNVANFPMEFQEASPKSIDSKSYLLKCYSLPRKIQFLKFDQNNFFTCVTA